MEKANKKRVLISGAGIAGLTAAYWLHKTGWDVVIIEKADKLREGEYVIDFSGTGFDVVIKMGLADAFRENQMEISTLSFKDANNKERTRVQMKDFVETLGVGDKHVTINRRAIQNLLYDKVKDNVEVRFSNSITSINENATDEKARVVFENGAEEYYDLIVGADGLHSNVRSLVFGDESKFSDYLGYYISAFRIKGTADDEPGVMNLLRKPNVQAGILDLRDGDSLGFFVFANEKAAYVPHNERKQLLIDTFKDIKGAVPKVLNGITDDTNIYMDTTTQIRMPKWYSKKVVLVGDAAYCLTLVSGQGASMAMGGAYVLAEELQKNNNIEEALTNYDKRLRPFIEDMLDKSKKFASNFIPSSDFGLWVTDKLVALSGFSIIKNLAGKLFSVQSLFELEAEKAKSES